MQFFTVAGDELGGIKQMKQNNSSGGSAEQILDFDKDAAGQRIYPVEKAHLNLNEASVMSLDRLVVLAAEYKTPHFVIRAPHKRVHYAYVHPCGLVVAYEDEAATKPAEEFLGHSEIPPSCITAGVQAAPLIEVRA